ncbi:hypothetical protein PFICI_01458 [Pestalotiopsis fici W106-1]|uniref:AA1-like domain-containing protein n=1 Tax=Pestalotiopsis fici (strain W106-1 / CGMCC3.15140) TaxID=1229662 RepID=W3XNU3_PESFW|nr:uncharacterized protein PFICI_01458 [Pestalotiopsis fici W106-1]ETS87630.1 hypothetical protein PFICI_01458 [Pestalotiopsis fici W106-1]
MRYSTLVVGLLAEIASSAFVAPVELAASACTLPSEFTIKSFTTFSEQTNGTYDSISFHFTDAGTGIDTSCEQNSTSVSTSPNGGTARYYCDDENVQFIYQTTGIVGLTMIEKACPDSDSGAKYEASGNAQFNLTCTSAYGGQTCTTNVTTTEEFSAINPISS